MGRERPAAGLVQGTLDMLILRRLLRGPMHGWGIARDIRATSGDVLRVEEGSLYPALRRLEVDGDVVAEWAPSENNRRARFYAITRQGRRRLEREERQWMGLVRAIGRVLEA